MQKQRMYAFLKKLNECWFKAILLSFSIGFFAIFLPPKVLANSFSWQAFPRAAGGGSSWHESEEIFKDHLFFLDYRLNAKRQMHVEFLQRPNYFLRGVEDTTLRFTRNSFLVSYRHLFNIFSHGNLYVGAGIGYRRIDLIYQASERLPTVSYGETEGTVTFETPMKKYDERFHEHRLFPVLEVGLLGNPFSAPLYLYGGFRWDIQGHMMISENSNYHDSKVAQYSVERKEINHRKKIKEEFEHLRRTSGLVMGVGWSY